MTDRTPERSAHVSRRGVGRMPRGYTPAMVLWSVGALFGSIVVIFIAYHLTMPDPRRNLVWIALLIGLPGLVVSVLTGLVSSLGARVAMRLSGRDGHPARSSVWVAGAGAGVGAVVVGALPLGALLTMVQVFGGAIPFAAALPVSIVVLFVLCGGFTAVWSGVKRGGAWSGAARG